MRTGMLIYSCWILQSDYGLMVFADIRYQRHDKRDKLPGWITSQLRDAHLNLSTDMLLAVARQFMRGMGQVCI
jgi:DNA excision repair protein ERCC-2